MKRPPGYRRGFAGRLGRLPLLAPRSDRAGARWRGRRRQSRGCSTLVLFVILEITAEGIETVRGGNDGGRSRRLRGRVCDGCGLSFWHVSDGCASLIVVIFLITEIAPKGVRRAVCLLDSTLAGSLSFRCFFFFIFIIIVIAKRICVYWVSVAFFVLCEV